MEAKTSSYVMSIKLKGVCKGQREFGANKWNKNQFLFVSFTHSTMCLHLGRRITTFVLICLYHYIDVQKLELTKTVHNIVSCLYSNSVTHPSTIKED